MSGLSELIATYRASEKHEGALQLLMDHSPLRYCGLWGSEVVRVLHSYPIGVEWDDLWECVDINHKVLGELADDTEARARFQIMRLRTLRLIYPDGQRTVMANKAITKFMVDRLRGE